MKELLKEKYKQFVKEVDDQYKNVLINEFGEDFKYIFEVPSNFFVYTNYKDCHEEGYLSDGVCIEEECDYLDTILAPLGYSNMSDSTYGWEAGEDPLFTKEELIELLNNSMFIQATNDCSFTTEEEDIEKGKHGQEIYAHFFCWTEQSMLETIEDYLATPSLI